MKKGMMALIGMVVALVFILIALIGPWYAFSMSAFGQTMEGSFGLFGGEATVAGQTMSYSFADVAGTDKGPIDTTMYLTVIAFIFALLALICIAMASFNLGNANMMGKLGGIFGILTFLFALIAAIYFMTLEAWSTVGFWNEMSGPGYAWYMMIIGAIVAIIFSIPMFTKKAA